MPGVGWRFHKGHKILFIDFANSDTSQIAATIEQAKPIISGQPPNSILCLVETINSMFSIATANAIKDFVQHNKPYMKMTAIVGIQGLQKIVLDTAIVVTKRKNLIVKNSKEEALDFLVSVGDDGGTSMNKLS